MKPALLEQMTCLPEHEFWPDDLPLSQAVQREQLIVGHRQITDAYLIALAASRGGIVATLDRGMLALATGRESLVEILQGPGMPGPCRRLSNHLHVASGARVCLNTFVVPLRGRRHA